MIQVIGFKRALALFVLIAVNAVLAASVYMYFIPQNEKLDRDLRMTKAQISEKRSEADRLRVEYQQIQDRKAQFETLTQSGFFSSQSRVVARKRIESIQKATNILTARYNIKSAEVEKNPEVENAGHVILDSAIDVSLDAMDDVDFFNFIYWIENAFPGHVSMKEVSLRRVLDINEATLRQIGIGTPTVLISGRIGFDWRTMVPKDQVEAIIPAGTVP